jgi:hypothetical protein
MNFFQIRPFGYVFQQNKKNRLKKIKTNLSNCLREQCQNQMIMIMMRVVEVNQVMNQVKPWRN